MLLHSYPVAGDVVRLDGYYCGAKRGSYAVLQGREGRLLDAYYACFSASAHRDTLRNGTEFFVSCSGGPVPEISIEDLVPTGETKIQSFWRFKDGIVGPGRAEYYELEVAVWSWIPGQMRPKIDNALRTYRFWAECDGLNVIDAKRAAKVLGITVPERPLPDIPSLIESDVPKNISEFVIWLCSKAHIRGLCDPMYLSNVIASETQAGDGRGNFWENKAEVTNITIKTIVDRICSAYRACLNERGVTYSQVHQRLEKAFA